MRYPLADFQPTDAGRAALLDCYNSGMISSRSEWVERFERAIAEHAGTKYAVACSSGTAALHLACAVLGLRSSEHVLISELTYIATANAVSYAGATPVPLDVDSETWNIRPELVEEFVRLFPGRPHVKAVICTHLLGSPCDMTALREVCSRHDLFLIEDACEAWEGRWDGKALGGIGDIGCFSFYGNKHITTGEGGALVTNHEHIAAAARHLRSQAGGSDYVHDCIGFNYRMTGLQAAVGFAQTQEPMRGDRQFVLMQYQERLPKSCHWQRWSAHQVPGAWVAGVELPCASSGVRQSLAEEGIESRPMFRPISEAPMYADPGGRRHHPNAYHLADHAIMLPCLPGMSGVDVGVICDALARAVQ